MIPDKEFFEIVSAACREHGTLLIMDEVATGFGRCGAMFGSTFYGLEPDIMCLGKGITGDYGGLGATIMTEEVAKSMEFEFSVYSTFGWHPLAVEAALANLSYLLERKENILKNVSEISKYFDERLGQIKFKYPAKVRIKGLAIGIEFQKEGYAADLINRAREKGLLITYIDRHTFNIFPALNIDKKSAEEGLNILESCV